MIRKVTKVKHGGRIYESIVVLDSNENIIVPPSLYLTHLSINTSSPLTVYNYSHTLNKYFEYINNEGIDWKEVTDVEMSQFIYDKFQKKQTVKENTVEVYATVLEGFYKWAWTSEQLTHPIKFNFTIYSNGSNEKNRKKYTEKYL